MLLICIRDYEFIYLLLGRPESVFLLQTRLLQRRIFIQT